MRRLPLMVPVLLLVPILSSPAWAETLTLPRSSRPAWLSEEGLVMAGSWEPLPFRVRRDGSPGYTPTAEQAADYRREHSPEMIQELKALGVNFVMTHCYKGGGLGLERDGMNDAVKFARRCHEAGLHVGVYAYSGALMWEPLFEEIPAAESWLLLGENGKRKPYGSAAYRYFWNRNHPGAVEFYRQIVRFAVRDIGVDLVHLDNYTEGPGYDAASIERFRGYLAETFSPAQLQEMGLGQADQAEPPRGDGANVLLRRAWQDFCCRSLADSFHDMSRYARSLRGDVLMECNPGGLPARIRPPVDHARLLEGGEAIWNEGLISGLSEGKLQTAIPTYKLARRMGNMVFRYVRNPMQMAEAMAFNLDCLGCLCWFEYGRISDYPGDLGRPLDSRTPPYVKFYRDRRELFRDTEVVADAAVLRSFPSQVFGPPETADLESHAVEELIAERACFQIIADQHLADLDRYRVLVLAGCLAMSDADAAQIRRFVEAGGRLCVSGPLATHDEWMVPRTRPALADLPADRVVGVEKGASVAQAVELVLDHEPSVAITPVASGPNTGAAEEGLLGVCAELTERPNRRLLHLVNYRQEDTVGALAVRIRIPDGCRVKQVTLASPGREKDLEVAHVSEGGYVTFVVPRLDIYEVAMVGLQ
ncbi:MAG: hypothetical protein ACYC6Y_11500 [Thermoguttaceae bacterium]